MSFPSAAIGLVIDLIIQRRRPKISTKKNAPRPIINTLSLCTPLITSVSGTLTTKVQSVPIISYLEFTLFTPSSTE